MRNRGLQTPPPARSDCYRALSHRSRRALLETLTAHDWPRTLADLAKELAVRKTGSPIEDVDGETVRRIYVGLGHEHVTMLADAGVVRFDDRRRTVSLSGTGERALSLHESEGR